MGVGTEPLTEGLDSPVSSSIDPLVGPSLSDSDAGARKQHGTPTFPSQFMKGIGMSVWQNSSDGQDITDAVDNSKATGSAYTTAASRASNWYNFARARKFFGSGKTCEAAWKVSNDFWNQYETHIKLASGQLGANSFRFSFEWARLEPDGPGKVDEAAVLRYHAIIDSIRANGMEPMCTLHHFTHPQWFEDLGGFTKEENIDLFVDYCRRVFGWFGQKIKLWATFNEPTCFAFVGYIVGLWCPGQRMCFTLAGKVLLNLLKAHVQAYQMLKAMPDGREACIGLVHQHIKFVSKSKYALHINLLCRWMTYWFASEILLRFFTTGVFEWKAPWKGTTVTYKCKEAPYSLDWWGINYYSYPCVSPFFIMGASKKNEPVSDTHFRIHPQGLYDSIKDASVLKVPIYITETGMADKDGRHRRTLIEQHTQAFVDSIRDGYDVRGMYYWTLMDNIEWHEGFHIKFGLFSWDPTGGPMQDLKLRRGSEALREVYDSWPETVEEMHATSRSQEKQALAARRASMLSDLSTDGMLEHLNPAANGQQRRHTVHSSSAVHASDEN